MDRFSSCPECGSVFFSMQFINSAMECLLKQSLSNSSDADNANYLKKIVIHEQSTSLEELFKALNIDNYCCRMHQFTNISNQQK